MSRIWGQTIVAKVKEFDRLSSFDQIHDFNDLLGHEAIPWEFQILYRFVWLQELTEVFEILFIVDHDLFCFKMDQFTIIFQGIEHQGHGILSRLEIAQAELF